MCILLEMLATAVAMMKMVNATRTQRLLAGLGVLILVDIIWVASSEITKVVKILSCITVVVWLE